MLFFSFVCGLGFFVVVCVWSGAGGRLVWVLFVGLFSLISALHS